jgi:hypothetical protein
VLGLSRLNKAAEGSLQDAQVVTGTRSKMQKAAAPMIEYPMHYLALKSDPQTTTLTEETALVWLTLTVSLIEPAIKHSSDPELGIAGLLDRNWCKREAERLTALLLPQTQALPSGLQAMPLSLKKLATRKALQLVFTPHNQNLVSEIREGSNQALPRLLSHSISLRRTALVADLERDSPDDFARFSYQDLRLKLFDPSLEEWRWYGLKLDKPTAESANTQAEIYISSTRKRLTLRSARQPTLDTVAAMQARL